MEEKLLKSIFDSLSNSFSSLEIRIRMLFYKLDIDIESFIRIYSPLGRISEVFSITSSDDLSSVLPVQLSCMFPESNILCSSMSGQSGVISKVFERSQASERDFVNVLCIKTSSCRYSIRIEEPLPESTKVPNIEYPDSIKLYNSYRVYYLVRFQAYYEACIRALLNTGSFTPQENPQMISSKDHQGIIMPPLQHEYSFFPSGEIATNIYIFLSNALFGYKVQWRRNRQIQKVFNLPTGFNTGKLCGHLMDSLFNSYDDYAGCVEYTSKPSYSSLGFFNRFIL